MTRRRAQLLQGLGQRIAPPRFLLFLLVFAALFLWISAGRPWAEALIIAFNGAALLFLAITAPLLCHHDPQDLRDHAAANDANRAVLLVVTGATIAAVLAALAFVLPDAHTPAARLLIVATLAIAWLFSNSIYALHYAHLYYMGGDEGGVRFSGDSPPDYADFVYFAFTLGMTFQTSDTEVTTPKFRRIVTLHSMLAFVFNLGAVAFAINVLGSS